MCMQYDVTGYSAGRIRSHTSSGVSLKVVRVNVDVEIS
jgi:hypothetical protein